MTEKFRCSKKNRQLMRKKRKAKEERKHQKIGRYVMDGRGTN